MRKQLVLTLALVVFAMTSVVYATGRPSTARRPEPELYVHHDGSRRQSPGGRSVEARRQVLRYQRMAAYRRPCTITSGKDGEFGAVRSVAAEVLVGKTETRTPTLSRFETAGRTTCITARSSAARDADHLEAGLHPDVGQLDAGRRRGEVRT